MIQPLLVLISLYFSLTLHARDIKELHLMDTFSCQASQDVEYKSGKSSLKSASQFRIPTNPGGYVKLHSTKLNMLFEAHFAEGVNFSLKQLNANKDFPYKMKKRTDKKSFVKVDISSTKDSKIVFTLNCLRR